MTITVSTTDKRDGKALALFARSAEWQQGRTKGGRAFFAIPGSEAGLFHMTDTRECSCADFQRARNVCKHVRAVRFWMAAFKTGAVAPKPRPDASGLDDRVALTPDGAAYLASQDRPMPTAASTEIGLEQLEQRRQERISHLRLLGYTPDEYSEDAQYRQVLSHIARLETRVLVIV